MAKSELEKSIQKAEEAVQSLKHQAFMSEQGPRALDLKWAQTYRDRASAIQFLIDYAKRQKKARSKS